MRVGATMGSIRAGAALPGRARTMRSLIAALLVTATALAARASGDAVFLVAGEDLLDPNFERTVVLVTRQAGFAGPVGVIVNRPSPVTLARAFPDVKALEALPDKIHFGGPVARSRLVFVLRASSPPSDAVEVMDGVYMSWSGELLGELLARPNPVENLRVYAGHAGWAPGQLESEVARGSWKSARPDARSIFEARPDLLWPELHRRGALTTVRRGGD
jgi:putative transcriptional regulator